MLEERDTDDTFVVAPLRLKGSMNQCLSGMQVGHGLSGLFFTDLSSSVQASCFHRKSSIPPKLFLFMFGPIAATVFGKRTKIFCLIWVFEPIVFVDSPVYLK